MKKQIDYGSYASYKETVKGLTENLKSLLGLSEEIALVNTAESIRETLEKTAEEHFEVAIVGEFKRGKSTLINAMLGQEVLPADVLPATATLNRVTYSEEPYVQVEYKNGKSERVDINKLEDYVTKLTAESEERAETVKEATVYYDTEFCKNNVDIIDTPGLNDDDQMTNVTLSILPKIDAAVFVISANSPFSQFEKEFLEKKMLTSDVGRIIFVVNCFGTFSQADENKIVETVRGRIGKYVMEKAKKVMGEDSREFAVYKRKIGTPRVIGVYAKQALTAKETGDKEALEKSNFPEFEKALETMLTKERGVIALQILANKITNSGTEILRSVVMQENALMMANDEFMEKYDEAIKEIGEIRNKKRQEFVKINDAANQVFNDLQPVLDSYWTNIEQTAMEVIDNFQMSSDDFKKDQLKLVTAKLTEKIPFRPGADIEGYLKGFKNVAERSAGIRRPGSAALDLCWVACGRYGGFWEFSLKPWDVAAGGLIVLEAGGLITDLTGGEEWLETGNVCAGNPKIFAQLLPLVGKLPVNTQTEATQNEKEQIKNDKVRRTLSTKKA